MANASVSTEVLTHVIVTFSKSHHFITALQEEKLRTIGLQDSFTVNGATIKASNIAEILPIATFYDMHPEKRPAGTEYKNMTGIFGTVETFSGERRKKALKSMRKGLLKCVIPGSLPPPSLGYLVDKVNRLISECV